MEISSHYRQLLRELNEQRQHGILCDACVIVDGKIFKAHKNVLLGSSRYFKTLYCQVRDCCTRREGSRKSVKFLFSSQIIVVLVRRLTFRQVMHETNGMETFVKTKAVKKTLFAPII